MLHCSCSALQHIAKNPKCWGAKNVLKIRRCYLNIVPVGLVLEEFQNDFQYVTSHIIVKHIQAKEFQDDIGNHQVPVLQIDYVVAYQYQFQDEVQGALWTRASLKLFTSAPNHEGDTKT